MPRGGGLLQFNAAAFSLLVQNIGQQRRPAPCVLPPLLVFMYHP